MIALVNCKYDTNNNSFFTEFGKGFKNLFGIQNTPDKDIKKKLSVAEKEFGAELAGKAIYLRIYDLTLFTSSFLVLYKF